jgi:hypothetical protein
MIHNHIAARDNDGLAERIAGARALYERPGTPGEKAAAEAALRRMGVDPGTFSTAPKKAALIGLFGVYFFDKKLGREALFVNMSIRGGEDPLEKATKLWKQYFPGKPVPSFQLRRRY